MREGRVEINQVAGQTPADRAFGGRNVPDINQPRKSNMVRNIIGAGILAATIGGAAFAALNLNKGSSPETTPPPAGGIVEPSESPIPTPVKPSESIQLPTASPTEVATPSPEATPTKTPIVDIESIIEAEHPKVKAEDLTTAVSSAYENNSEAESIWPIEKANRVADQCINGDPHDTTEEEIRLSQATLCPIAVSNLYRIYRFTGDIAFLRAAEAVYNYSVNELNNPEYTNYLNDYLTRTTQ